MIFNPFFSIDETTRPVKDGEAPAMVVSFKSVPLAVFVGENLRERAHNYIKTYGYLSEWRRRYLCKEGQSWDDSLFVQIYP